MALSHKIGPLLILKMTYPVMCRYTDVPSLPLELSAQHRKDKWGEYHITHRAPRIFGRPLMRLDSSTRHRWFNTRLLSRLNAQSHILNQQSHVETNLVIVTAGSMRNDTRHRVQVVTLPSLPRRIADDLVQNFCVDAGANAYCHGFGKGDADGACHVVVADLCGVTRSKLTAEVDFVWVCH